MTKLSKKNNASKNKKRDVKKNDALVLKTMCSSLLLDIMLFGKK